MGAKVVHACLLSRRVFVRSIGHGAAATALGPWLACGGSTGPPPGAPGGDAGGPDATGVACPPYLTPVDDFFRQFGGRATVEDWEMPELTADHLLRIEGLVASPTTLTLADLEADTAGQRTVVNTLMCVLGFRAAAIWTGVPLRLLLERAGIDREATRRVRFFGADGFENNLRVQDIFDSPQDVFEPLVAFRLYDRPLPRDLGFPFRLLLNDRYGYKCTKWLARIEVTDSDQETGQYQSRGYGDSGTIEPVPIVENSRLMETVEAGAIELCGFALSGYAAIERVDVAVDEGPFAPAEVLGLEQLRALHPELDGALQLEQPDRFGFPLRGVWCAWRHRFEVGAGKHRVRVRARDGAGGVGDGAALTITAVGKR